MGRMEHCEGKVSTVVRRPIAEYDVAGLQELLEKFAGKRVSIVVEEVDEDDR